MNQIMIILSMMIFVGILTTLNSSICKGVQDLKVFLSLGTEREAGVEVSATFILHYSPLLSFRADT